MYFQMQIFEISIHKIWKCVCMCSQKYFPYVSTLKIFNSKVLWFLFLIFSYKQAGETWENIIGFDLIYLLWK